MGNKTSFHCCQTYQGQQAATCQFDCFRIGTYCFSDRAPHPGGANIQPLGGRPMQSPVTACAVEKPVDIGELLARCLGRVEIAERVLSTFRGTLSADVAVIEESLAAGNAAETASRAHRLKGGALSVAAAELGALAASIEHLARSGDLHRVGPLLEPLRQETARLREFRLPAGPDPRRPLNALGH